MTSESKIDFATTSDTDNPSCAYDNLIQTQRTLSLVQQDITRLPSDIAHLQSDLARRLTEEQHLLRYVEKQRQIVASCLHIDKLFDEILAQVFLLLVHKYDLGLELGPRPNRALLYPWRTAAVRKRWRAICMDTPRLWTYICLGKPIHSCADSVETARLYGSRISMQLQLSKAAPLSIRIHIDCECPTVTSITQAVVAHAHRWKEADISASGLPSMKEFLRNTIPPGTKFTVLEDLEWSTRIEHLDIPFANYGTLESLRHAKLKGLQDLPLDARIPWGHLISLEILYRNEDIRDLLSVLSYCQALHTLKLTLYSAASMNVIE